MGSAALQERGTPAGPPPPGRGAPGQRFPFPTPPSGFPGPVPPPALREEAPGLRPSPGAAGQARFRRCYGNEKARVGNPRLPVRSRLPFPITVHFFRALANGEERLCHALLGEGLAA